MKQLNYKISSINELEKIIKNLEEETSHTNYKTILIHIYSIKFSNDDIIHVSTQLKNVFSKTLICGTSSNGDICDGYLTECGMVLSISLFESSDINVTVIECPNGGEESAAHKITQIIDSTDNIKAAELLVTIKSLNSHKLLLECEKHHKDIKIFGGGSADENVINSITKVSDGTTILTSGVALITYSGEDLEVFTSHAIGWKSLGKQLIATKVKGNRLYELDNMPAGVVYSKYLDIHADDDFFSNILEFPIMSHQRGHDVLRLPFNYNADDQSLDLASDIDEGTPVNLSYGDPDVIMDDVNRLRNEIKDFAPQAIFLYSCGVRRLYWQYLIDKETADFESIAPTSGFYSVGEIIGMDGCIIEHQVTIVAAAMREGAPVSIKEPKAIETQTEVTDTNKIHSQISMVRRLANFINVASQEIHEANELLKEMAETDQLTGFYNRRMLDRLVSDALNRANKYHINMILGILDIDDFKQINDTYGHLEGDRVLKELSTKMYEEVEKLPSGIFGRWGGEEFLFLAPTLTIESVLPNIEEARQRVSSYEITGIGKRTVSLGLTEFVPGDTPKTLFARADSALYQAKETGKNKTCVKYADKEI